MTQFNPESLRGMRDHAAMRAAIAEYLEILRETAADLGVMIQGGCHDQTILEANRLVRIQIASLDIYLTAAQDLQVHGSPPDEADGRQPALPSGG